MSIVKIERDIQLIEEELEKINITISDPIERNEYKKELQRKIKRLNRAKHQIEQEINRQQLESHESKFRSNSDLSIDLKEPEISLERQIEIEKEELTSAILDQSLTTELMGDRQKQKISWIKIQFFIILVLVLTTAIGINFAISYNNARQAEEVRFKELARQEVIKAQAEAEKAKQESLKAEREKQEAIEEVEKAKKEVIRAKKKADDLIKNNLLVKATTRQSPTEFVKQYYADINDRNYNLTWQQFAPKRRAKPKSYNSYISWWNSVENTEIEEIKTLEQNDRKAVVYVELNYFMKTGTVYKQRKSKLYLAWNGKDDNWLIENHQQL